MTDALPKAMGRAEPDDMFVDGFMCGVDWECEIGANARGNKIYPSVAALKECLGCWVECGIVKVRVQILEVVEPSRI